MVILTFFSDHVLTPAEALSRIYRGEAGFYRGQDLEFDSHSSYLWGGVLSIGC